MTSKERDSKSFHEKLKVFLRRSTTVPPARSVFVMTPDLVRDISPESPANRRLRAIKDISDKAVHLSIQDVTFEILWKCTNDILHETNVPIELRHAVLIMLRNFCDDQTDGVTVMRTILFHYLRDTHTTHAPEDYHLRFKLLFVLTNSGKNIKSFEEQIGWVVKEWLPSVSAPTHIVDLLQMITNIVKFNAAYLEEAIVKDIVEKACHHCTYSSESGVVQTSLSLLEAVVSYSLLPRDSLRTFVCSLCRTVNVEHYCQLSWKLMRNVLGADTGHAALQEMVECIESGSSADDAGLVRGAVFYMNMALWGARRVPTLRVSARAVLPAFLEALRGRHVVVTYEVLLAVQSLISRYSVELTDPVWELLLIILRTAVDHNRAIEPPNELISTKLHAIITQIEQLHDSGQFYGDGDQLLELIDYCGHERPESSVNRLVRIRATTFLPASSEWIQRLSSLAERYIRQETRPAVRLHTLHTIREVIERHRLLYMEELMEAVGLPILSTLATDADATMRAAAARAAADLAALCHSDSAADLIDQLEKILNRPFEIYVTADVCIPQDADTSDIEAACTGLLRLLQLKWLHLPATHALRCLLVLLDHLEHHYRKPMLFVHRPRIRIQILDMLFGLRTNVFHNVGFMYDSSGRALRVTPGADGVTRLKPLCSPFLLADPPHPRNLLHQPQHRDQPPGTCVIPVGRIAGLLVRVLTHEKEWSVMQHVLVTLPLLLQCRALAVGRRAQDLDLLASTLCAMVSDSSLNMPACFWPSTTQSASATTSTTTNTNRPLTSEFHGFVLPALAAFATYHAFLESHTQSRIVRCLLKYGMVLRSPQPYINALTIFALEMRDTMVKMLPGVLLDLSKVSDTKAIACSMLEFLSTLTRLPRVFASFVEDQYMSVFAILLPYTNPSRYNHYVVSLAHHVIAAWFLKCRLSFRRNFVRFIIHGLHNYIIMPFEEQLQYQLNFKQGVANEDSSNRKRSSSLGSKNVPRSVMMGRSVASTSGASCNTGTSASTSSAAFHVELTETCMDLLARYTFTPCAVKPQRSDLAEFLFKNGVSHSWMVGHKVITITTSGCLQNTLKQGPCDRCSTLCREHADSVATPLPPLPTPGAVPSAADKQEYQPGAMHPPVQVQVSDASSSDQSTPSNQVLALQPQGAQEIRRYSKRSLQHSRSTETSVSSLSISDATAATTPALHPPSSGYTTRQNSCENSASSNAINNPLADVLSHFAERFEKISKEIDTEEIKWSRIAGESGDGGFVCPCWCSQWAEVHIRSPTGDVSFVMRMQNPAGRTHHTDSYLEELLAVVCPPQPTPAPPQPPSSSSGVDSQLQTSEGSPRSRSNSSTSRTPAAAAAHQLDLHKSSSDSFVASEKRTPHASSYLIAPPQRMSTKPINIPSSPQRQSSSSTTDEDDNLLNVTEGKSRHPVRRSNSSPEMSSSWKLSAPVFFASAATSDTTARIDDDIALDPEELILLPARPDTSLSSSMHASKKVAKKPDFVSCEAIPEEMSGTSPLSQASHSHHHLMTYNSDPGTSSASSETAAEALPLSPLASQPRTAPKPRTDPQSRPDPAPLQKTASEGAVQESRSVRAIATPTATPTASSAEPAHLQPLPRCRRSNTISVMSPMRAARDSMTTRNNANGGEMNANVGFSNGLTPAFVLLQLYHNMSTYPITPPVPGEAPPNVSSLNERPLKLVGVKHERTIRNIDLVPPVETYKVGVLYVGPGQQDDDVAILRNEYGSVRYTEFLSQLGTLVSLEESAVTPELFVSLEKGGKDGQYTYVWDDDMMQVLFHIATAMPTLPSDERCNEKLKYIGNDYVSIVYNDSGEEFNITTIKGQFNLCVVVVEPLEYNMNRVLVKTKDETVGNKFLSHLDTHYISDQNVTLLARQLALHAHLASQISKSLGRKEAAYASNALERLRMLKRLRRRVEEERATAAQLAVKPYSLPEYSAVAKRVACDDFNNYT